ncbi:UvrD-helicase domain-containing protein [Synechococcus sp. BA-124 BA4]|uniref:UvrD-helicase domain-containing protein n=1 Tax=unclassified Synechococcus TaxID=2626047 RepID=UPI0018CF0889|nr:MULTISPECIES: UvrD-helicase domain-containing protein [unclassified Synechococcus]MEA5398441.1 UvrD-helicase domain-containing protein [Synechococcus sp. BA-124 BA4]QPN57710.1 exodeoxyribonuclease V subunit gamma [Synechococcus sp. CBW1107]CAK6686689.1 ATP-dependent DNA helicase PcrA [Synechococcus sp. CBW1107]
MASNNPSSDGPSANGFRALGSSANGSNGFLSGLNEAQRRAVDHHTGPLLVVAGAGSGKTRALTHRIAHLIGHHGVDPAELLAVTFTNKAARGMKERLEVLLAERLAQSQFCQPWSTLPALQQRQLRARVYQEVIKDLWIGTFHALFSRLLRFDVDKFRDPEGLIWTRQFSIYDEGDAQSLVKEIVTKEMQLDPKRFEPKKVRWAISNAKNQGWLPEQLEAQAQGMRDRKIAEAYRLYRRALAANNSLDFDDLLLLPVQLLRQNEQVRAYWHRRFRHVLVDEYQDTNRTQYELIKLLVTDGQDPETFENWSGRSVFVVGDADQSIYSFRAADFTILMGFQDDFGDGAGADSTATMVKLEENYRSTATILEAANALIANNRERIDKILRPTRGEGEPIRLTRCDDEIAEAEAVVHRMRTLEAAHPDLRWGDMAVLYRTNAQSRALEEALVRWGIPYLVVGGLRFYDRREIKDILGYLRLLVNPADNVSLLRVLNVPRRGIGKTTLERLTDVANQLGVPLWEVVSDQEAVRSLAGRSARGLLQFSELIHDLRRRVQDASPSEMVQRVMEQSGYVAELIAEADDEAEERRRNLQELVNAALQFQEENEEASLEGFLASAALSSDADDKDTAADRVILMTLHASKGLEFPVVFLVGMEQGLFPSYRSLDDPSSLEEERRLCYVGMTRAKERLFLTHACERRLWGGMREPALPSVFLSELPDDLIQGDIPRSGGAALRRDQRLERLTRVDREDNLQVASGGSRGDPATTKRRRGHTRDWSVGDRLRHDSFGEGIVTHRFGSGEKISIAVKFEGMGPKILDPHLAPIEGLE